MSHIKFAIRKHLSANQDSWASTIDKVCQEVAAGRHFVEQAMKDLVEKGEVIQCSNGRKYMSRLEGMENPTTSGGFDKDPRKKSLNPDTAT